MATKKRSEEEKVLTAYIDAMKLVRKRLLKDGLINETESAVEPNSTCRCCLGTFRSISHLRLDREKLASTLGLALIFGRVIIHEKDHCPSLSYEMLIPPPVRKFYPSILSNLHLQWNNLEKVEGLEILSNTLRVLCLSHNKISRLEDSAPCLLALRKLGLLDLSYNEIESFSPEILPFPRSLVILDLRGNNISYPQNYHSALLEKLPKLLNLDGEDYNDDSDESNDELAGDINHSKIEKITSEAVGIMESTVEEIVGRSRARIETVLNQMRTPRNMEATDDIPETDEQ